jgi:glyoxylase-like metal-dependent hydrolase (beta-lactamase superfamily II)
MTKRISRSPSCDVFESPSYRIARFPLGMFQTNCYVVSQAATPGRCWIVDASFEPEAMIEYVKSQGLTPEMLVLTHAHVDHIAGVRELRTAFPALPIVIHALEEAWLTDPMLNLSGLSGMPVTSPTATSLLAEGQTLRWGGGEWKVLHTPGHSPGSVTLVNDAEGVAFVGDALFNGSIGRTDFPGCSFETLERSIRTKLYALADETTIFPGHGPESTIGRERRMNPFVNDAR